MLEASTGFSPGGWCVRSLLAATLTFPVEDHASSAAPQGFVGGGGDHVTVLEGGGHHAGCHQAADVGHVSHEVGAVLICDLPHPGIVQIPGVAADP